MISLDQVFLLEQKVESAVAKIQQLQSENDALRTKVAELTNALSAKSEQLSSFENDQTQIESGIKKALDRLNSIENSVLKAASQMNTNDQAAFQTSVQQKTVQNAQPQQVTQVQVEQPVQTVITSTSAPSFDTMETTEPPAETQEPSISFDNIPVQQSFEEEPPVEDDSTDGLGFDIF